MTFTIYPAIDLRHGQVVRLRQGDPAAQTVYGDDPAAIARQWADEGAEWLHVVNLDGALTPQPPRPHAGEGELDRVLSAARLCIGEEEIAAIPSLSGIEALAGLPHNAQIPGDRLKPPVQTPLTITSGIPGEIAINLRRLAEIRAAVDRPIQFGGGLRTVDDVALALALGATRVVLGTVAVRQPAVVAEAVARFGAERIVVGIDARDGLVATHGWLETSALDALTVARRMADLGVRRIVFTDIARDGMLSGANVAATAELARASSLKVIASGGVAALDDIRALAARAADGIEGVIVGQALYTGAIDLKAAIDLKD